MFFPWVFFAWTLRTGHILSWIRNVTLCSLHLAAFVFLYGSIRGRCRLPIITAGWNTYYLPLITGNLLFQIHIVQAFSEISTHRGWLTPSPSFPCILYKSVHIHGMFCLAPTYTACCCVHHQYYGVYLGVRWRSLAWRRPQSEALRPSTPSGSRAIGGGAVPRPRQEDDPLGLMLVRCLPALLLCVLCVAVCCNFRFQCCMMAFSLGGIGPKQNCGDCSRFYFLNSYPPKRVRAITGIQS